MVMKPTNTTARPLVLTTTLKWKNLLHQVNLVKCGCLLTVGISLLFASLLQAQTQYFWTGAANGTNLVTAGNWDPNGVPAPSTGDIMTWDGRTTGPVFVTFTTTAMQGWSGQPGLNIYITSNQRDPVTFYASVGLAAAIRLNGITIDPGAGAFTLGDDSTTIFDVIWGGLSGQTHTWINNSANPATLKPNVRFRYGGGQAHTLNFGGTGDWYVFHHLRADNSSPTVITVDGPGRLIWTRVDLVKFDSPIQGPFTINGGTVIIKSADCLPSQIVNNTINNYGVLVYDAPSGAALWSMGIYGTGSLVVSNGSLTLSSGASTFSGEVVLAGGTLTVAGAENPDVSGPLGRGGVITFAGGTLKFSDVNAYDYSPRFNTQPGQIYKFDTGGRVVRFNTGLTSSGGSLYKYGAGTLILGGVNTYTGPTVIEGGKLVIAGSKTGTGNITVKDGATLGVVASSTQVTPGVLTLGTTSGVTLEFDNISSTSTAPIAAGTLSAVGTVTINVNGGTFAAGQKYPLLTWTSGTAPTFRLGNFSGGVGYLSVEGNAVYLNVTALAYVWTGAANNSWDFTTMNWVYSGSPSTYINGSAVVFDDSAPGQTSIILNAVVTPSVIVVNNNAKDYSLTSSSSAYIDGTGSLIKSGTGSLTLSGGANRFTGPTVINNGTLIVETLVNGGLPSDIGASSSSAENLVLDGGALVYTGPGATIDRLFTLGVSGGVIQASGAGALRFINAGIISLQGMGGRMLTLAGDNQDNNLVAASIGDAGGPTTVIKSGSGKWILAGENTYSGGTVINGGVLQVGNGGPSGSVGSGGIINNGQLIFNKAGTTLISGGISGVGSLLNEANSTLILAANNTYRGGTTNRGVLQLGTGGPTGVLPGDVPIHNDGLLIYNSTSMMALSGNGIITGSGNLVVQAGRLMAIGANSYTGWTLIHPGATFQPCRGNAGQLISSVVTNNGTLRLVRQDGIWPDTAVFVYSGNIVGSGRVIKDVNNFNPGSVGLTGTNTYTGGTYIAGGALVLGDGMTPGAGSIVGDVIFTDSEEYNYTQRSLIFNRPDDVVFSGNIVSAVSDQNVAVADRGRVIHAGIGKLTLTGINTYEGQTVIQSGTLQIGNGGASGTLGRGNVQNDGLLIFNRSGEYEYNGAITGSGMVIQAGTGTIILNGNHTYTGNTVVSNGTLIVNGQSSSYWTYVYGGKLGGNGTFTSVVEVDGGTIAPGSPSSPIGTLTVNELYLGGTLEFEVDKSHPQLNDKIVANAVLRVTKAGTLKIVNRGPSLQAGDRFVLFNMPVENGNLLTITGEGATWKNDLAVDGSVTVLTAPPPPINPNPPVIQFSITDSAVALAWPTNKGWILQTNSVGLNAPDKWFAVPGSENMTNITIPIDKGKTNVYFRMVKP